MEHHRPLREKGKSENGYLNAGWFRPQHPSSMKIINDERCTRYSSPAPPGRPDPTTRPRARLPTQTGLPIMWNNPFPADETAILRAHSATQVARLNEAADFDADTP